MSVKLKLCLKQSIIRIFCSISLIPFKQHRDTSRLNYITAQELLPESMTYSPSREANSRTTNLEIR
jgi:hypothetical protein